MKSRYSVYDGFSAEEVELLESIIKADALMDAQLAELENLLERKRDATLGLPQLRHLRQACERMRHLLGRCEKLPATHFAASR
jgi:hypothetical protein